MSGLPRKYAKMGFKRGWKAYKASKRTTARPVRRDIDMARRRRSYPRARRVYARSRTGGGAVKPILDGLMAGAAGGLIDRFLPTRGFGQPLAAVGVGYWRNNPTLKTEGARELGAALVNMFVGGNGSVGGGVSQV